MIGLNTAAVYILQTIGSLYLLIVLLRFYPATGTCRLLQPAQPVHCARHPSAAETAAQGDSKRRRA